MQEFFEGCISLRRLCALLGQPLLVFFTIYRDLAYQTSAIAVWVAVTMVVRVIVSPAESNDFIASGAHDGYACKNSMKESGKENSSKITYTEPGAVDDSLDTNMHVRG